MALTRMYVHARRCKTLDTDSHAQCYIASCVDPGVRGLLQFIYVYMLIQVAAAARSDNHCYADGDQRSLHIDTNGDRNQPCVHPQPRRPGVQLHGWIANDNDNLIFRCGSFCARDVKVRIVNVERSSLTSRDDMDSMEARSSVLWRTSFTPSVIYLLSVSRRYCPSFASTYEAWKFSFVLLLQLDRQ